LATRGTSEGKVVARICDHRKVRETPPPYFLIGKILANQMSQPLSSLVEQLTAHVLARLHDCVHDFGVQLRNEGVVLTGWTHSYFTKQRVQQCVREMTDLPVSNEIEVVDAASPRS
jgi:hypothetical protein